MEARIARRKSKTREIDGEERHKRPSVVPFIASFSPIEGAITTR